MNTTVIMNPESDVLTRVVTIAGITMLYMQIRDQDGVLVFQWVIPIQAGAFIMVIQAIIIIIAGIIHTIIPIVLIRIIIMIIIRTIIPIIMIIIRTIIITGM